MAKHDKKDLLALVLFFFGTMGFSAITVYSFIMFGIAPMILSAILTIITASMLAVVLGRVLK
jgi:hypothetical protein